MKKMLLLLSLFSMVVFFLLGLDSYNKKDDEITSQFEELTFHHRVSDGIIMLDENNNTYFVDYFSLEDANVKINEETKITVALNTHGEILSIQ